MQAFTTHTVHKVLAKILFIVLPTVAVLYHLLMYWNVSFEIPTTTLIWQTGYFAIGCIGAVIFYALGFRFIPTFILLVLGLYFLYKGIDATAIGEFDTFFMTVQFAVFAVLFTFGWLAGWGILRVRKFSIVLSVLFLLLYVFQLGEEDAWLQNQDTNAVWLMLLKGLAPIVLYTITSIYFSELINRLDTTAGQFWWTLAKRSVWVVALIFVAFWATSKNTFFKFEERLVEAAQSQGGEGIHNMLKKEQKPNGEAAGYSLNKELKMSANNQKEHVLMFTAHINNFFDDGTTPNPLYLVSFYYTRYNEATEAFEIDTLTPDKDFFSPGLSKIPLYHVVRDTAVLAFGKQDDYKEEVTFEVYNKNLTEDFFVGPATSYFVQPIAVEPSFRTEYTNAYRGKSRASRLNSAYFVYNVDEPVIRSFQELRNKELRKADNYSKVDTAFMNYYTDMPQSEIFTKVDSLAHAITRGQSKNIDKVLAIRDYFLERDANNKRIFRYSDNPGEPDLPGASKLLYFLFESKQGYCAYYAAATLYMLRSLGIPSRVVGGFLTEDRSADKNRGWYWYYADQAHAWVQVYFPGVGWIDFDTTIDNEDARESEQTDGTPPLQPAKATFAAFGTFTQIDTVQKKGIFKLVSVVLNDRQLKPKVFEVNVDLSLASVRKDTASLSLSAIKPGDSVTIVSYAKVFEKIAAANKDNIRKLLPTPLPVDEVHLMPAPPQKDTNGTPAEQELDKLKNSLLWTAGIIMLCLLLLLSLPLTIYGYWKRKLKNAQGTNALTAGYKLQRWVNILFVNTPADTDQQLFTAIDKQYGIASSEVLKQYHAYKYGKVLPQDIDRFKVQTTHNVKTILQQTPVKRRCLNFLQVQKVSK